MAKQTVRDLARQDKTSGIPTGQKADFVIDAANGNMNMTVKDFSERVVGQQVSESYVRKVLKEANPSSFGIGVDDMLF
jgi:hypothetical protein